MKKNIQTLLYFFLFLFQINFISAQIERVKFVQVDKNSKTENQVEKINSTSSEINKKEVQSEPKKEKKDINLPAIQKSTKEASAYLPTRRLDDAILNQQETERLNEEKNISDNNPEKFDNNPIFPDFQVVATKETVQEEKIVPKETGAQQLQKLDRVPVDNFSTPKNNTINEQVSISPSKRKYLESRVQELESELKMNTNSAVEIEAKNNELVEIKKLLVQ